MKLRRIEPMKLSGTKKIDPDTLGDRPELCWARPGDLLVDGSYQRDLTKQSVVLIRRIVAEFSWARIKPPVAVRANGGFHVIDGQHTAIAAASIGLKQLPIFVVAVPEIMDQARAFVSHNRNRINIKALDIHRALLAAGDPLSRTVANVCRDVGVTLCATGQADEVGETQAVTHVRQMFERQGAAHARQTLSILVRAKVAPIAEAELSAASRLIAAGAAQGRLAAAIRIGGKSDLIKARGRAATDRCPTWQPLMAIWERRMGAAQ